MNSLFKLLKINYINNFGLNAVINKKIAKEDKSKSIKSFGMMLVIAISVIIMATVYAEIIGEALAQINLVHLLPMIASLITVIITFMLSIFKADGTIFGSKDLDFLLSLPLSSRTILASKLIELLSLNIGISALVMIPSTIVYYIKSIASISCFLYMIVGIVILPLIPIILASIVAFILNIMSSKFRFSKIIYSVGMIGVIIVIFIGSLKAQDFMSYLMMNASSIENIFEKSYIPSAWFASSLINGDVGDLLKFIAISIVPFILLVFIFSRSFKKINSNLGQSYQKSNYKISKLKQKGMYQTLLNKEIKRDFASTSYVFNTLGITAMLVIMSIVSVFSGDEVLGMISKGAGRVIVLAVAAMFGVMSGMASTTPSSISIEGKNLWILKSLPIDIRDIFKAKVSMSLILSIPAIVISSLIISFGVSLSIIDTIFIIVFASVYNTFIAISGLFINILYPKFDWKQEIQAVKNTISVTITLFLSIIPVGIGFGVYKLLPSVNVIIFMIIALIIEIILVALAVRILNTKGQEYFKNL